MYQRILDTWAVGGFWLGANLWKSENIMVRETAIKESSSSSPEGSDTNKRLVTCNKKNLYTDTGQNDIYQ